MAGFAYVDGKITNDIDCRLVFDTNNKWSGMPAGHELQIPSGQTKSFKVERLPSENSGPAAAVVYKIDGSDPFYWMFSWIVGGSDGKNKVYTEICKTPHFQKKYWDNIYLLLTAPDSGNQSYAEWPKENPKFKANVTINDVNPYPSLHAIVSPYPQ